MILNGNCVTFSFPLVLSKSLFRPVKKGGNVHRSLALLIWDVSCRNQDLSIFASMTDKRRVNNKESCQQLVSFPSINIAS